MTRATLIRLDAQTECPSAEIPSSLHQSPWDTRPGSKSSQTFKRCRKREVWPTGVEKKLILRTHTPRWGLWDLTKQHHGAIYVLKLKYANLIKMNTRERNRAGSTLIEVFNVTSVNLREMLCISLLSASCRSLVFCILTAYWLMDGLWNCIWNIL